MWSKITKTAVMYPNWGSRQFAQQSDNHTQPQQNKFVCTVKGYNAYDSPWRDSDLRWPQPEHSAWQSYTPNPSAGNYQPTDMPAVQTSQPTINLLNQSMHSLMIVQASNPPAQPTNYAKSFMSLLQYSHNNLANTQRLLPISCLRLHFADRKPAPYHAVCRFCAARIGVSIWF